MSTEGSGGVTLRWGNDDVIVWTNMVAHQSRDADPISLSLEEGNSSLAIIELSIPLGDAAYYWHPYGHWGRTPLPPNWQGSERVSLVRSMPVGCLYDYDDRVRLAFAVDGVDDRAEISYGVSEETGRFEVKIRLPQLTSESVVRMKLLSADRPDSAISEATGWLTSSKGVTSLPAPAEAAEPVFSTWYAFHHEMDQDAMEKEAREIARLGFRCVFIDFGWQVGSDTKDFDGCGEWVPDAEKFHDFGGMIDLFHSLGLKVVVWVAPFLLGAKCDSFSRRREHAPHYEPLLKTFILDPRVQAVREDLSQRLIDLVARYRLDGLKIDFLEMVDAYADAAPSREVSLADGVQRFLREIRDGFSKIGLSEPIIEFRQPYTSPALAPFGNVVRAEDCPADELRHRSLIIDARLSGSQIVHSDMMMWHPDADPRALVRHLHAALLAVPQISMQLSKLSDAHRHVLTEWLRTWRRWQDATVGGTVFGVSPHANYPVAGAISADLQRAAVVVYERNSIVVLPDAVEIFLVNATTDECVYVQSAHASTQWESADHLGVTTRRGRISGSPLMRLDVPSGGSAQLWR